MVQDDRVSFRVPGALLERLDALIPKVGRLPELALSGQVSRSDVTRLALLRGIAALEAETRGGRSR
jgi:hypothetical protein